MKSFNLTISLEFSCKSKRQPAETMCAWVSMRLGASCVSTEHAACVAAHPMLLCAYVECAVSVGVHPICCLLCSPLVLFPVCAGQWMGARRSMCRELCAPRPSPEASSTPWPRATGGSRAHRASGRGCLRYSNWGQQGTQGIRAGVSQVRQLGAAGYIGHQGGGVLGRATGGQSWGADSVG